MKRFFFGWVLLLSAMAMHAQNLDKAKELLKANKVAEAKTEIDKVLADAKNQKNADAWLYKAKIYNAVAVNEQLKATVPDAFAQSYEAIQKYLQYDDKKNFALMQENYKPMLDIYQGYFQAGAAAYNTGKYTDALVNFRGAIDAISFMNKNGWVKTGMDTTATLYAGVAAEKANKRDDALIYYKTICDSGITKISGNDMIDLYKWVADYYNQKKDIPNCKKYLEVGQKYYPNDVFWADSQVELARKSGNKDSLFAQYEQVTKQFPTNHLFFYNYGLELYQYASDTTKGAKPANSDQLVAKAEEQLKKSVELKPDYPQSNLVLGQISYNEGVDIQQSVKNVKGTKPEDLNKRKDLRAQAAKKFDDALPYFDKVDQALGPKGKLKQEEKTVLKDAYDLMITIYEQKGDKKNSAIYTDKFNNVDKVH